MITKVIISNDSALSRKYGAGLNSIKNAIQDWIEKDKGNGISSQYLPLDDTTVMGSLGLGPVVRWKDEAEVKRAIDEIHEKTAPDYLVIFGSSDVIPHQELKNPVGSDPDSFVPSDLPYACNASYGTNIGDFVGPTRVISRLPDVTGDSDPSSAVKMIEQVTLGESHPVDFYMDFLGVSAEVWSKSTQLSLVNLFGNASEQQDVPKAGSPWPATLLSRPSHFFNCHGAPVDSKWYGQSKKNLNDYPVAQDSAVIFGNISPATVIAAECCYGAELYSPSIARGSLPLCNTYLQSGAYAFWGSSNIAYGPAASNDYADLICQYFFDELLKGASTGRAALMARQRYARKTLSLSPVDLKTLAQFMIYADASTTCVKLKTVGEESMKSFGEEAKAAERERKQRRAHLLVDGEDLQRSRATAFESIQADTEATEKMNELGRRFGILEPRMSSVRVLRRERATGVGVGFFKALEATRISEFHLLTDARSTEGQSFKLLEVAMSNGDIIFVKELYSR